MDAIFNVSVYETPILSRLDAVRVDNTFVQWLQDSFRAAAANAWIEDTTFTAHDQTVPSRADNIVQIFYRGGRITDTERAVAHAGMDDPLAYYEGKNIIELKKDIELALVKGSAVTGDTDTACQLKGLCNVIATNTTNLSGVTMTETVFGNLLELCWNNTSAWPNEVYVGPKLKRTISQYSTAVTRNVNADEKKQVLTTNFYDSDFGTLTIFLHRDLTSATNTNEMLIIDPSYFVTGWLKPLQVERLDRDGLRDRWQLSAHLTLIHRHHLAGAYVKNIQYYIT